MEYGACVWCEEYGVRAMMYGTWCMESGVWYMVTGIWCVEYNVARVYGMWCMNMV